LINPDYTKIVYDSFGVSAMTEATVKVFKQREGKLGCWFNLQAERLEVWIEDS